MKIEKITPQMAHDLINSSDIEGEYRPIGRFICKEGNVYVGIDNSRGCCWVEEFNTKKQCKRWLLNE